MDYGDNSKQLVIPGDNTWAAVDTYLTQLSAAVEALPRAPIVEIALLLSAAAQEERLIFILGNGGSAATASHLACDLARVADSSPHLRLRPVALTDNMPLVTAWGNDTEFEQIFAQQIRVLARPGDIIIAISASGNSPNVLAAARVAREMDMKVIGVTGFGGGQLSSLSDVYLVVPGYEYGPVEDMHLIFVHALTMALRSIVSL